MRRSCARPGCGNRPAATLSYDYANRSVWIDSLAVEPHPMTHDLCVRHADALSVPKGWRLHDRRTDAEIVALPLAQAS